MTVTVKATTSGTKFLLWCLVCGALCVADDYASATMAAAEHLAEHGV